MESKRFITILVAVAIVASILSDIAVQAGNNNTIQVFIGFKRTPGPSEQALVRSHGGAIKYSYSLVPAIAASIPAQAIQGLSNNPNITYIEPVGVCYAIGELQNSWGVVQIGADTSWSQSTGTGVKVAVIDTGIDTAHVDLDGNYGGGIDIVNNDNDPADDYGHGTHVAGIIAAELDNSGVVGVAYNAKLYAVKVLDSSGYGTWDDVAAGLQWCVDNGIQIANMSLGGKTGNITLQNACDAAASAGVVLVAAAGNSGNRRGTGDSIEYPAKYSSVIAVAATDKNDSRASFSSTGSTLAISAPGVSIYSTFPTYPVTMGYSSTGYATMSGTSMASPHVAGTVALMLSVNSSLKNSDIRTLLTDTAVDLGDPGWDSLYGWGLVDAAAAVNAAKTGIIPEPPQTGTVHAASITYSTSGGRNSNKNLLVTVALKDGLGVAVSGASVSITLNHNGIPYASGTGTTGTNGSVTFTASNAPSGTYTTTVTGVNAAGLTWDNTTPTNSFKK